MSDNWITILPTEPTFVPNEASAQSVLALLHGFVPDADEIRIVEGDQVIFIDAGANFESMWCPMCRAELSSEWWGDRMGIASQNAFSDLDCQTPCCDKRMTLNDIEYNWPQGFARWHLEAMNPNIGKLSDEQVLRIEAALGHSIRVVYTHI